MGKFLDDLWAQYNDFEKKNNLLKEFAKVDRFVESLNIPDYAISDKIKEYCYDILSENQSKEKEAFFEGVRQGSILMLNKM